jgi:hypothetical protein
MQNWALAHRILMPVFGPIAIRHMFDEQLDIASQMVLRWDRLGADNQILASDDFTKYLLSSERDPDEPLIFSGLHLTRLGCARSTTVSTISTPTEIILSSIKWRIV